ncbi:iron-sulfur cluster assembly scaffold protein [Grimontia marina]|uniref:NifU-like protein n=1 Tax=Grimontia marina TaxID=646534 RepID=A0A128FAB7_9GAMM|nr:iron-sulfur cluster assembly scaffold protein [Grimontia marina]CZF83753.1 NifU-like protein [Grimontia marina]
MYNSLIVSHFTKPKFTGEIEAAEVTLSVGNSVCGDKLEVQIETKDNVFSNVAYQAWGCATSVAAGDIFCDSIYGKKLEDIAKRDCCTISSMLGELEPSQCHCVDIMTELHKQLFDFIKKVKEHE